MTTGTPPTSPSHARSTAAAASGAPRSPAPPSATRELDDDAGGIQASGRPTRTSSVPAPWSPGKAIAGGNNVAGWLRSRLGMEPNVGTDQTASEDQRGAADDVDIVPPGNAPASPAMTNVTTLGDVLLQADNEQLFRHGLFNAVGNAILLCVIGLCYCVLLLLEQFRSPILWALLVSLALRDVKTATVSFWTRALRKYTLIGLVLTPFAEARVAIATAARGVERAIARAARADLTARLCFGFGFGFFGDAKQAEKKTPPVSPVRRALTSPLKMVTLASSSPRSPGARLRALRAALTEPDTPPGGDASPKTKNCQMSASNFHFRWLLCAGCALEAWNVVARDWALTRSIVALALVALVAGAATIGLLVAAHWYTFARPGAFFPSADINAKGFAVFQGTSVPGFGSIRHALARALASSSPGGSRTLRAKTTAAYVRCDLAIREALIASLHFVVAVGLITGGIVFVAATTAFFTVNIARESSGAVAALAASSGGALSEFNSASRFSVGNAFGAGGAMTNGGAKMMDSMYVAYGRAVEKHLPSAIDWAASHVERTFPGANATELWESMQHIYAQLSDDDGVRGGGQGGGSDAWATSVKEAGSRLGSGDFAGAFSILRSFGDDVFGFLRSSHDAHSGGSGSHHIVPGMDNLVRVTNALAEALKERASGILAHGGRGLAAVTAWTARASFGVFGVAGGIVNFILKAVVFLTVLFHILNSELDPAVRLVELIPVNDRVKDVAVHSLTRGVRGVFVSCAKLALFHAAFTWVTFRAFGVHFVYTSTLASGATAILPLLASWSVSVPAALGLLAKGEGLKGVALVVMHWVVLIFVDIDIYQSEIQVVHPYIVGLSVVGGMSVWDHALEGAVLGPLLVTALATARNVYRELVRTPPAGGVGGGGGGGGMGTTPATARMTATARRRANGARVGWTPGRA